MEEPHASTSRFPERQTQHALASQVPAERLGREADHLPSYRPRSRCPRQSRRARRGTLQLQIGTAATTPGGAQTSKSGGGSGSLPSPPPDLARQALIGQPDIPNSLSSRLRQQSLPAGVQDELAPCPYMCNATQGLEAGTRDRWLDQLAYEQNGRPLAAVQRIVRERPY